jgi:site-specific DNA recombinase
MMRGKEATAGRGRWASGQTPYGYRNTSQGLVVVPEEAAVLRLAWEHLREGRTQTEAAGLLNAAGLRTRAGREWSGAVLMQCLRRPAVYGHVRFGYARRATAGEVVWVPDAHEPILRPEDVAALGYRLGEWYLGEQRDRTEHRRKHVLSGLLYCLCGTMMRAGAGTPPRILYNCPEGGRRRGHSPAQVIGRREPEVWAWVWQHAVTERRLVAIHRRAIREAEEPSARYAAQVAETETALGGAERRLQNLVDAVAQEGLSLALRRALQEQEQVVKRLQAEVARLAYAAEVSHPPDLPPDLRARITRLRQVVPTLTAPRQNQLLRHVLERVDVAADGTLSCCVASAQVLRLLST